MPNKSEPTIFVTNDYALLHAEESILHSIDRELLAGKDKVISMEEAIELVNKQKEQKGEKPLKPVPKGHIGINKENFELFAESVKDIFEWFEENWWDLNEKQVYLIKNIRTKTHFSWRAVAHACYHAWNANWQPPSNQVIGELLCRRAAEILGEDPYKEPWN